MLTSGWIIFGLITGVVVHTLYPNKSKGGVLGALMLGISGALIGLVLGS